MTKKRIEGVVGRHGTYEIWFDSAAADGREVTVEYCPSDLLKTRDQQSPELNPGLPDSEAGDISGTS